MVTGLSFHRKVIAVFGLPNNYPEDGPQIFIALSNSAFIIKEYDKRFSLNALFKEIYSDETLKKLIPTNLGPMYQNKKKK